MILRLSLGVPYSSDRNVEEVFDEKFLEVRRDRFTRSLEVGYDLGRKIREGFPNPIRPIILKTLRYFCGILEPDLIGSGKGSKSREVHKRSLSDLDQLASEINMLEVDDSDDFRPEQYPFVKCENDEPRAMIQRVVLGVHRMIALWLGKGS